MLGGGGGDAWSFIWYLNWWPWAVLHGRDPLYSHMVYAPIGYSLAWGTSVPTASLLALPVTLTLGAAVSFNLLGVLAPSLGASAAYCLVRRCSSATRLACAFCGFLFGFSSYENGQLLGHLNLDLTFPIPLACLLVVERVRARITRRRFVILLMLTLLAEFGLSSELLATFCSLAVPAWITFLLLTRGPLRAAIARTGAETLLALLLASIVLAPWLLDMARHAADIPDYINLPSSYSTDLANFLLPTRLTALGGHLLAPWSRRFTGNLSEQGAYLGLPLLLILLLLLRERGREPLVAALLLCFAGLCVATLGPILQVAGRNTHLPLPWWLATRLPLLGAALPARIVLYISLVAALAAALWAGNAKPGRSALLRPLALLACCILIVPARATAHWEPLPLLAFFSPKRIDPLIRQGANVLILPYGASRDRNQSPQMLWQWQSGMRFSQSGGSLSFRPLPFLRLAILQQLLSETPGPSFGNDITAFCANDGVSRILAGPGEAPDMLTALRRLGWKESIGGGIDAFQVPPARTLRYVSLRGDIWAGYESWSWMGRDAIIETHGRAAILRMQWAGAPIHDGTVTVSDGTSTRRFQVPVNGTVAIDLGPDRRFVVVPAETFLPRVVFHTPDPRTLSFYISIEPGP